MSLLLISLIFFFYPNIILFENSSYLRRIISLFGIAVLLWTASLLFNHPDGDISWCDGQLITNPELLGVSMILLIFAFLNINSYAYKKESYIYLLTNLFGCLLIITSNDFLILFLSWEIINISTYLIITSSSKAISAGLKYFLLSALNSTILLLGIIFIYYELGSVAIYSFISFNFGESLGIYLCYIALFFKLSIFPFYLWAPDLYSRCSYGVNSWLMIIPKIGFGYLLSRLNPEGVMNMIIICGLLSILIGSISLNTQYLMKRFIAYSSISNIGYIILSSNNTSVLILTLLIYSITLFGFLYILNELGGGPGFDLSRLQENTVLTICFGIILFSFIGIPPLLGFYSKLYIISQLLTHLNGLIIITILLIIISSVISCIRYLFLLMKGTFELGNHPDQGVILKGTWLISTIVVILLFGWLII